MDQLHKCFENKYNPNIKEYVSQFGNVDRSGRVCRYSLPGVHVNHWREISFQEFAAVASPEALVIIEFINKHKRLPNFIMAHTSFEHRSLYENTHCHSG